MAIKPIEIIIRAKDEASSIFGSLQSKVVGVGVAIAGYFGISAFVGAVKGAADLEAKLSEVKAVSGATAAEMVLLRQAAENAGASTKYTATEAAQALGNLSRAGLSAKDSIAALPAVLQLAQAGDIELGQASEYVTKAVMGLGLQFTDTGRVADVLAMGANASNTSVTGLAQALSYAAPVAHSLGLSLETTVAIIGKFADAGIDASRAGTALNAILSQFADPASKFRQELAAAGITTTNFEQALRQLAAAGPAGSKAINAVGTEAGPALRALLNQGIGALDDLKGKLDNAAGSAAATAKIMQDNLTGSFTSLGSAWDTVKNTLATPVLPVLKDAVDQLSTSFRSAVSDGTIAKFGTAIATAFEAGIKWAREFLGTVDFAALTTRMQAFATQAQDTFTKIGEYATNAGNIVKLVYGVMSAGVNTVMTAVYGIGVAFAGVASHVQTGIAIILEGLAKITFGSVSAGFKAAAAEVRLSADATWAATREFANKTVESFVAMGDGAQIARDGWAGLTNDTSQAASAAQASAKVFGTVAETLREVGGDATAAGQKAQAAGILHKEAADKARAAIAELKTQYEAAVATGNWQLAAEKVQALKKATDDAKAGTTDLRKKAEDDALAIAAAFERMGIKTTADLKTQAATAKKDFEDIKASGLATADGLATAFKKYAEKAIAANGGVATEAIKSEAAMRGLQVQTDSTGKSIVSAMDAGATSTDRYSKSIHGATQSLVEQNAVLRERKAALDALNASTTPAPVKSVLSKDDMKGVDNTGLYSLQQKQQAGTLSAADLATAEAALTAATTNLDVYQKNSAVLSLQGAASITETYNAARTLAEQVRRLAGSNGSQTSQGSTSASTAAKSYTVNVNLGGTVTPIKTSSDADAQALIGVLQRAKLTA